VDIIRIDGGSGIVGSEVTIHVNTKPPPPEEPPQLDATEIEKSDIGERLRKLASEIEDHLGEYPLSIPEAIALSGITDIPAVFKWRYEWDAQLAKRYCAEIYPKLNALYEYARVRGFFDPELEECYSSRLIASATRLPALLRKVAGSR
jgi:hypothetical protein